MTDSRKVVGVIGGMGPAATVEYLRRLVEAVPAHDDADHIHVIADINPAVPSRIQALLSEGGEDPAPALLSMAGRLESAGADFLTMPCNTAHHYHSKIASAVRIPVLDVVSLTVSRLVNLRPRPRRVGLMASPVLRRIGLFDHSFSVTGLELLHPGPDDEAQLLDIIRSVKSRSLNASHHASWGRVGENLARAGAEVFLVACTELSLLAPPRHLRVIDTLDVLVNETVRQARPSTPGL